MNIPNYMLSDAQQSAEYIAYAINYISGISGGKNVSIMSWSQGGMDVQWALKYWTSARSVVTDFIAVSADFHGSTVVSQLCGSVVMSSCPPSVWQQDYNSKFVKALRSNGGDSAYVPTTILYTSQDFFVNPQSGQNASAFMKDSRKVGVSNSEIDAVCKGKAAAGRTISHANSLINGLTYALTLDALRNPGPGNVQRVGVDLACSRFIGDATFSALRSESGMYTAGFNILGTNEKVSAEPEIQQYARAFTLSS
jgi:hypothetical protein